MSLTLKELREKYVEVYGTNPGFGLRREDLMVEIAKYYSDEDTLLQLPVMLPQKIVDLPKERQSQILQSDEWVAQEKKNAVRAKLHIGFEGSRIDGRTRSDLTCLYIEKTESFPNLGEICAPSIEGTVLDGELEFAANPEIVIDGKKSIGTLSATMALMSALPEKAIRAQELQGFISYFVFDIVRFQGKLLQASFKNRYRLLQKLFENFDDQFIPAGLELLPTTLEKERLYDEVCARGGEGIILRHINNVYEPGKRVWSTLKHKKTYDYDCFITGYSESEKGRKFEGMIGSLEVSAFDENGEQRVVGHVGPGTDVLRRKISNPDGSLKKVMYGRTLAVRCMGWTTRLLMYHTALVRYRSDKDASDCRIDFEPIRKRFIKFEKGYL